MRNDRHRSLIVKSYDYDSGSKQGYSFDFERRHCEDELRRRKEESHTLSEGTWIGGLCCVKG